ncbi:S1/P1 nuclease [Novosphingobium gossypii]|uniref:S1/P1 nuclease n=1 Tax=Novosphingobium gossypii TaxID=1604774 RepID=UPI003D24F4AA
MRHILAFSAVLLVLMVFGVPHPARAWGTNGHLTICDLAYRNFTATTRASVASLLHSRTGGITVKGRGKMADRRYTAFNLGCLEEDKLPRRNPDDHFINVPRETDVIPDACLGESSCILSGISRDIGILQDASRTDEARVFALMALGHWIGDIHQPLHVSFADDRGGNGIDAKLAGRCGRSSYSVKNLHGVWDACLLEAGLFEKVRKRADFKRTWSKTTITYRAVDTLQANTSLEEERRIVAGNPQTWAQESFAIALDPQVLYCTRQGSTCRYSQDRVELTGRDKRRQLIDQAYLARFAPVAENRVRLAGFRLAHLVNTALDPDYRGPVRNSTQAD